MRDEAAATGLLFHLSYAPVMCRGECGSQTRYALFARQRSVSTASPNRSEHVGALGLEVLPLNYRLAPGGIRTRILPINSRVTEHGRLVAVPGDGVEPSRRWVRASVPRQRIPE